VDLHLAREQIWCVFLSFMGTELIYRFRALFLSTTVSPARHWTYISFAPRTVSPMRSHPDLPLLYYGFATCYTSPAGAQCLLQCCQRWSEMHPSTTPRGAFAR
jgi:hypothetical protein